MRTNSGMSAEVEDMSPSQTIGPGSPDETIMLERVRGVARENGLGIELAKSPAKSAATGRSRNDWQHQTVDDDELRLGPN